MFALDHQNVQTDPKERPGLSQLPCPYALHTVIELALLP